METVMEKIFKWLIGKKLRESENIFYYFNSLLLLISFVVFISNGFWNMSSSIRKLMSIKAINQISNFLNICIHFFTSLAIISFVVVIIAVIMSELSRKFFDNREIYFIRMGKGAEFRLSNSVECVFIFLSIASIFDKNVLQDYLLLYPDYVCIIMGIVYIYVFFTSSIIGIINRFFMLKSYDKK